MQRLITRSDLARLVGVSPAAVTKLCRGSLAAAVVEGRIDLDAPPVVAYLRKKGIDPSSLANLAFLSHQKPTKPRPSPRPIEDEDDESDDEEAEDEPAPVPVPETQDVSIEAIADLTIREVVQRFGTSGSLVNYVNALKVIEQTRWQRIKNEREEGRLIPKEYVKTHVFGVIDGAFRGLLLDAPKTLARRLYAAAKSGSPIEEGEQVAKEINSSHISAVKDRCRKALGDDAG